MGDFAGPLKLMGYIFAALGLLMTAAFIFAMADEGDYSEAAMLVIPLLFFAAGVGLVTLGRRIRAEKSFEIGHLAFWVFGAVGATMVVGGLVMAVSDPAGLFLTLFGAAFVGAAWLSRKIFTTPEGQKRVTLQSRESVHDSALGMRTHTRSATFINVPDDASEEEIRRAKRDWFESAMQRRPDWLSGRIREEAAGGKGVARLAMMVLVGATAVFAALGYFVEEFLYFPAAMGALATTVLLVTAVRQAARHRKFGDAVFILKRTPLAPGDRLDGVIETEAPRWSLADGAFRLRLVCEETTVHTSNDRRSYRTRELWSDAAEVRATGEQSLRMRVRFDTPEDQPGATIGSLRQVGVGWRLIAEADAPGVDFHASFMLPVVDRELLELDGPAAR